MTQKAIQERLEELAERFDVELDIVELLFDELGENEMYDALVTELEDYIDEC